MPREPNLWRPEDADEKREYITCATGLCTNLVLKEGDVCPEHDPERTLPDRSPSNIRHF